MILRLRLVLEPCGPDRLYILVFSGWIDPILVFFWFGLFYFVFDYWTGVVLIFCWMEENERWVEVLARRAHILASLSVVPCFLPPQATQRLGPCSWCVSPYLAGGLACGEPHYHTFGH